MLKQGTKNWSRACDTCRSAKPTVYCHADSAYLCSACDTRIHSANRVASRHKRVRVCEACECAPAAFLCRADAVSLCSSCDAEIHSANRLAGRHHRIRIVPTSGCALTEGEDDRHVCEAEEEEAEEGGDEAEAASWLLPQPEENNNNDDDENENDEGDDDGFMFCGDDEYLELVDCNNSLCVENNQLSSVYHDDDDDEDEDQQHKQRNYAFVPQRNHVVDGVVPVQCGGEAAWAQMQRQPSQYFQPGLEFDSSKVDFSYNGFISQPVLISSMEVGVVPDTTFSDVSMISRIKPPIGTTTGDLFPPMPMMPYTPMDREARVLRYREKKKTRKFEKKIRYASRKAYAEVRPRIKGRFVKRTDVEAEADQMINTNPMTDSGYGIVPSFSVCR